MKQNLVKGAFYIILSGFCFALMSAFVRMAGDLPSMQKAFFRNSIALLLVTVALWRKGESFHWKKGNGKVLFARSVFGTFGIIFNYYALDHINLGDANILNKLNTFVALIASAVFLKEKFRGFHLAVVLVAFTGCIFVVQPTMDFAEMLPALSGVASGVTGGIALTCVRELGKRGENGQLVVFYFSLCSTIVTLPFFLFAHAPMTFAQVAIMVAAGVCGGGGQIFLTAAYFHAAAKDISAFDYTQVLFAALFGFVLFDQIPNTSSVIGYVLIIATGIALFFYNKRAGAEAIPAKKRQNSIAGKE